MSRPSVPVILGGQATEKWPPELFVPENLAAEALDFFVEGTAEAGPPLDQDG